MSLPEAWVDRIFTKLSLVHGHQFLSRWDGLSMADVKADWGRDLACFAQHPQALWWALENLPGKPMNAIEFRALVRQAPSQKFHAPGPPVRLEEAPPQVDPQCYAEEMSRLREDPNVLPGEHREWARAIVARHRCGDPATPTVLAMATEALGIEVPAAVYERR